MIATLYLLWASIFGVVPTPPSACNISDIVAEKSVCNDSGYYNIILNFQHENTSDSFEIEGYGTYAYTALPVTLSQFKGDGTNYGFYIFDVLNHDCGGNKFVEGKRCPPFECNLTPIFLEEAGCDSLNQYYIYMKFWNSNSSDSFSLMVNGEPYGHFAYADLGFYLGPFDGSTYHYYEVVASDLANPDCKTSGDLDVRECNRCEIYNLFAQTSMCDSNGYYDIKFDFEYENTSDSFSVEGFGVYAYTDLPVTLYHFEGNGENHVIRVTDKVNPICNRDRIVEGRLCAPFDCDIGVVLTKLDCDSLNNFYVNIFVEHQNSSDSFSLKINGEDYGHFAYNWTATVLLNGNSGENFVFYVEDLLNPNCKHSATLYPPFCNGCAIYNISAERSLCDSIGYYDITFNFQHQSTSDSFEISGYGLFAYTDLPVTLHNFAGDGTSHSFVFIDQIEEKCNTTKLVEGRFCEPLNCELSEMSLTRSDCDSLNQFYITINFAYENASDSFSLQGNGHMYGHFDYEDLPVVLGPFDGNSSRSYEFGIMDLENPNCNIAEHIEPPYCDSCFIREISSIKSECDASRHYNITFDFDYSGTSDSFDIYGYGRFAYADLPVTIFGILGDGRAHGFEFTDVKNPNCTKLQGVTGKDCESIDCLLSNLSVSLSNCNEDHFFYMEVNFDYSQVSDSFLIRGSGQLYGKYKYGDLPISIGPINGNTDMKYDLVIEDLILDGCAIDTLISPPYCQSDSTEVLIKSIRLDGIDCLTKDSYVGTIYLSSNLPSTMIVSVWQGNNKLGEAMVSEFPKQYTFSTNVVPSIKVQEVGNPNNVYFFHYDHPDCSKVSVKTANIEYKVYPNPVTEKLYIESTTELSVKLKSINGRILSRGYGERIELNMSDFKPGVFILEIQNKQGIAIQKIIKM